MNKYKKLLALLLTLLLAFSITGCAKTDENIENTTEAAQGDSGSAVNIGDFNTVDINGNKVSNDIFKDYKLTVVNVWTTWCTYCIQEMPHLAELSEELKGQGVQIIGIVDDVKNRRTGEIDSETLNLTKTILQKTGVKYPILLPDEVLSNGILTTVTGYPTTYFVDSEGNLLVQPISGALQKEQWKAVINQVLKIMEESK